jgi:hypothetical protein
MTILRFIGYLLAPFAAIVALPFLVIAYVLLYCVLGLIHTWFRATRDPRFDPYWWT